MNVKVVIDHLPQVMGMLLGLVPHVDQNLPQCHILECHRTILQCTSALDQGRRIFPSHVSYHLSIGLHIDFHLLPNK